MQGRRSSPGTYEGMTPCMMMGANATRYSCILLLCTLVSCCAGCTGPLHGTAPVQAPGPVLPPVTGTAAIPLLTPSPVPGGPVFTNGSLVTDGPWISMNAISDQKKGIPFRITGSTDLPAKSLIQVIIVPTGPAAGNVHRLDDCILLRQRCVVYFARANDTAPDPARWSIATDSAMDLFRNTTTSGYTAILENTSGALSARTQFVMD